MDGAVLLLSLLLIVASLLLPPSGLSSFFSLRGSEYPTAFLPSYAAPTYSGYLYANASANARMYFAFYEATNPNVKEVDVPIILWLQGGPGCSGMIGNFYEHGPYRVDDELKLHSNPGSWNKRFGMLYVDNPVGTGFSIAEKDEDMPEDQARASVHLYSIVAQFFAEHPQLQPRPFFLAGESYAGKYVPAFAHHIVSIIEEKEGKPFQRRSQLALQEGHDSLDLPSRPFHLEGMVIGNGLTDPKIQVASHGQAAYQFGLIDWQMKEEVDRRAAAAVVLVEQEDWLAAHTARTELVNWLTNVTGLATLLDVRRSVAYHCNKEGEEYLAMFLNQPQVKSALHAHPNVTWKSCEARPRAALRNDTMKSTKSLLESLLPALPLLLYQGMYDIKDGPAGNEDWMRTLTWDRTAAFFSAQRKVWYVGEQVTGYWRSESSLTHVVLLGAGHEVPADQSVNSQNMIETWVTAQLHQDGLHHSQVDNS